MELCRNIHQIRIDFQVTETVSRYVFIYLITGKNCYLIDTGTAGSEHQIAAYMTAIGRSIREIKAILLTHSHPDHMGGAAAVQRASGCNIYASCREQTWIENIDIQFRVRPVPNFYKLLKEPAAVDHPLKDGEQICLEPGLTSISLETPGHSPGSLTYLFSEKHILFTGDAIPARDDFPIFSDLPKSLSSLHKLSSLPDILTCCPAWDRVYRREEMSSRIRQAEALLRSLDSCIQTALGRADLKPGEEKLNYICGSMGWNPAFINPLLKKALLHQCSALRNIQR